MWELRLDPIFTSKNRERVCERHGCDNRIKKGKYCCHECYAKTRVKKNHIPCKHCKNLFKPREKTNKFCCLACYNAAVQVVRYCENPDCKREIPKSKKIKKFCTVSCFRAHVSRGKIKNETCINCNTELSREKIWLKHKYCSIACYWEKRRLKRKEEIGSLIKLRKREEWKYPRRYIKLSTGWKMLAKHTWEKVNGPLPERTYIGFKDGDTFNDEDINNLYLIKNKFGKS